MTTPRRSLPTADWERLLASWLHDPPDKAVSIRDHESRALRYLTAALGFESGRSGRGRDTVQGDIAASSADRLPVPGYGADYRWAVGPEGGRLTVIHPLSGDTFVLELEDVDVAAVEAMIASTVEGIDDIRLRYLALWRLLPKTLAATYPFLSRLPADTRVPDHTIWQHLDATAGLSLALSDSGGAGFLSYSLGPVQPFIAAARSLRDLWTGSAILSWLVFQGLVPILESLGPTAVVFPALRGTPLMDIWLREQGLDRCVDKPSLTARRAPCIPNRFLAIVPMGQGGAFAADLAAECESRTRQAWKNLANGSRDVFCKALPESWASSWSADWDTQWERQTSSFFDVRTAVLPWNQCPEEAIAWLQGAQTFEDALPGLAAVRALAAAIPPEGRPGYHLSRRRVGYPQDQAGRWQAKLMMSTRLMEAEREIRRVPDYTPVLDKDGRVALKCTLMGTYEQVGPADLHASATFWEDVAANVKVPSARVRTGERFCAVALTKRLAIAGGLGKALQVGARDLRFDDTATLAASDWLADTGLDLRGFNDWNGQWLHLAGAQLIEPEVPAEVASAIKAARKRAGTHGAPPTYYAIIAMDGDRMGGWLRGETAPSVAEVYHPKIAGYFEGLPNTEEGLRARRPVGPALHGAISEALSNFAVHVVPGIVESHSGELIYAGGDDVLALVPCRRAAACARELELAFRGLAVADPSEPGFYRQQDGDLLMMGPKATVSAGIAIVHYKDDLRDSLELARNAEREAKAAGRNAVQIAVARRSGEEVSTMAPWAWLENMTRWTDVFLGGASDRWTYQLRTEIPTLAALPVEAAAAEMRRYINHAEPTTGTAVVKAFKAEEGAKAGDVVAAQFFDYLSMRKAHAGAADSDTVQPDSGRLLRDYLTLVQTASFVARGREAE
ncbi:MAG: type III-B CRISPR-associated protein Cas10/Cmr2 [Thermoleophilia bacterium]|jgi:CRISPR-associated protein Cmr2